MAAPWYSCRYLPRAERINDLLVFEIHCAAIQGRAGKDEEASGNSRCRGLPELWRWDDSRTKNRRRDGDVCPRALALYELQSIGVAKLRGIGQTRKKTTPGEIVYEDLAQFQETF